MSNLALTHLTRPASAGTAPYPGVILLHGLASNEHDLYLVATQLDPRLVALSVRAPFSNPYGGYAWYHLEEGLGLGVRSIESSLEQLAGFIDEAVERYHIDPTRLYVGGFSMGAAMAGAVALLYPDKVAGAIMVSGYLPPNERHRYRVQEAAGHPFFQAHGILDRVVSIEDARRTRDFLESTPVDLTYGEYPIGHEVSLPELMDLQRWLERVLSSPRSA